MAKHKAPFKCKASVIFFGVSPSAKYGWCTLGCVHRGKKCENCEHNLLDKVYGKLWR